MDPLRGSVKWFDSCRGFGFITPEGGGRDIFVHHTSIASSGFRSLTAGERVEFVVSVNDDGRLSAVSVTPFANALVHGERYFRSACFRCNEVGHMARDCKSNGVIGGLGFCHSGGMIDTFTRAFPAMQPTNILNPLKPGLFSPLTYKNETLEGEISEGMYSEEDEEEEEEEEEDEEEEDEEEEEEDEDQSDVSGQDNEPKRRAKRRNWAELPHNILLIIFRKITSTDILWSAQFVCRTWRQLSHEPALWRCINLNMYDPCDDMVPMAMMAVDRSEGCVEELYMENFPTDEFLLYIAERATRLRSIHLISASYCCEGKLAETLRKFPLLEELEMSLCYFDDDVLEQVGPACPQLKRFRLDHPVTDFQIFDPIESIDNDDAFAIAKHFKQLRRLELFANRLNGVGLLSILDNCPDLEYLDIRQCFNVDFLDESLKEKCARIKVLRLPYDSMAGYEFKVEDTASDFGDRASDFGYYDDGFF